MIRKGLTSIIILGVLFVGLSRILGLTDGGVESIASYIAYPFLRLQSLVIRPFISWHTRKRLYVDLLNRYEQIVHDRDHLLKELISLQALKRYADDTKDLRDFLKRYDTGHATIAPILLKNFSGEHFYLVDAGENCGIERDMIALYNANLIGKVTEVYPYYSKIQLITDQHCNVAAYCVAHNARGIHHGLSNNRTTLSYVDHRDIVTPGDLVLSSGEGGLFPRGFGLGKITYTDKEGYNRSIVIEPLIDLQKIEYCCIVQNTISKK